MSGFGSTAPVELVADERLQGGHHDIAPLIHLPAHQKLRQLTFQFADLAVVFVDEHDAARAFSHVTSRFGS